MQELDAGSWFDPAFAGQRISTLQQVIDTVGHRLLLNIELKSKGLRDEGLAVEVVRIVEDSNLIERVVISSSDEPLLLRGSWFRHLVRPEALHPEHTMVDGKYLRWAKERGYRVHVWTADDPGDMEQFTRDGVDLIITNRPDLLRQVLAGRAGAAGPSGPVCPLEGG